MKLINTSIYDFPTLITGDAVRTEDQGPFCDGTPGVAIPVMAQFCNHN